MPKHKQYYVDKYGEEQARKMFNRYKLRNYAKGRIGAKHHQWTADEDRIVLEHKMTDRELVSVVKHSVSAIQKRRCYLKKLLKQLKGV